MIFTRDGGLLSYANRSSSPNSPRSPGLSRGLLMVSIGFFASAILALNIQNNLVYWAAVCVFAIAFSFNNASDLLLLAISFWAFLPTEYISSNPVQTFVNPSSILFLLLLFKIKAKLSVRSTTFLATIGFLFALVSLNSINPLRSAAWSFQFLLFLYLVYCSRNHLRKFNANYVVESFGLIGLLLSGLAIAESALSRALVYNGSLLPQFEDAYKWTNYSIFRVSTTLGHPLNNGLFFACISLLFILRIVYGRGRILDWLVVTFGTVGVFLSGSRSAIIALGAGIVILVVTNFYKFRSSLKVGLLVVGPTAIFLFAQSPWFQTIFTRLESGEGISSQRYREDLFQWLGYFFEEFTFLGSGPGTSGYVWGAIGNTAPLENGLLQLWVSLGFIAALTLTAAASLAFIRFARKDLHYLTLIPLCVYTPLTNFVDDSSNFFVFASIIVMLVSLSSTNTNAYDANSQALNGR